VATPFIPRPAQQIRVFLSKTPLSRYQPVWKSSALAFAELGAAAFFVAGVVSIRLGAWAPWALAAAWLVGAYIRAIDIESWGLLIQGGLPGRVGLAFGPRARRVALVASVFERVLFAALVAMVAGHYIAGALGATGEEVASRLPASDLPTLIGVLIVGALWLRYRNGLGLAAPQLARGVWIAIAIVTTVAAWSVWTAVHHASPTLPVPWQHQPIGWLTALAGLGVALTVIGGGDGVSRDAHEFGAPRVVAVRRVAIVSTALGLIVIVVPGVVFSMIVTGAGAASMNAPLSTLVHLLAAPRWGIALLHTLLVGAIVVWLVPAAWLALGDVERLVRRLATENALPELFAAPDPRLGTSTRAVSVGLVAIIFLMIVSGGQVAWLTDAYAVGIGITVLLKIAALVRLRRLRPAMRPFTAPGTLRWSTREIPVGLLLAGLVIAGAIGALLASGDVSALATVAGFATLATLLALPGRMVEEPAADLGYDLMPPPDLATGRPDVRPGCIVVPLRNPYSLSPLTAAFRAAAGRDIVVMRVRLVGADDEQEQTTEPTQAERELFAQVMFLAERHRQPVKLLLTRGHNVFDAVVDTVIWLRGSEVYVGESATLPDSEQARRLGEAWERATKPPDLKVRLVIHHTSGRADAYHLGPHPPALTPTDLDLLHRLWLDATKAVGPHVHHHDVVRAALTQMEQQLNGPHRDEALGAIREQARPADELAAAVHARDFSRLRDLTRNHEASELADILTSLPVEDQVVAFRVLPRKDAAALFEYLSLPAQEALLKALAQEDVAALLNAMAPDDRTMFLEELPAAATRQLLTLLTPAERSVALTLLGYPEDSVGRLMTPNYVAVREHWTLREVLDYVRTHGQDSETLNVIYVIDDRGLLIDDIRIREVLLTSAESRVTDLMDRRFVALKAVDDQQSAVGAFRQYDRSALPVTDTAGMLIGIVTIDDVLDVAEAAATKEIQKFGGSEAFDEPYMAIPFWRMIQKRAGWLTALFLGEMLTATAMGHFEGEIQKAVVLAMFVPLIISSGGNAGSQASTLVIRALALGEVQLLDWWRIARREIFAGLALGAILGSVGFFRITLWSYFAPATYGPHWMLVAFTVGLALVGIVLWGSLIGSLLPLVLRRLGFDPATSSAPFVATLVDVTGLVIYFSVALVLLKGSLL
jgi:magnesium transporter